MSYPKAIVFTTLGKHAGSVMNTIQMTEMEDCFNDGGGPKKRRRLTHLSPDEKIMRRKLKNRVAAQTARDRKKAQMTELEEKVAKLEEEKKLLLKEYTQLRASTQTLQQENAILKKQLTTYTSTFAKVTSAPSETPSSQTPCHMESSDVATTALSCKTEPVSPRSAEGTDSGFVSRDGTVCSLGYDSVKPDSLLCYLEEYGGQIGGFQSEEEAAPTCQTTIGELGVGFATGDDTQAGAVVGAATTELVSINELILTEHQYYKAEEPSINVTCIPSSAVSSSINNTPVPIASTTEGLKAELLLPAAFPAATTQMVVVSCPSSVSTAQAMTAATPTIFSSASSRCSVVNSSHSHSNRAALTRMVNPNDVLTPRPLKTEPEITDNGLLQEDFLHSLELDQMLESEDLFSLDAINEFLQFPSEDQTPQQQNMITRSEASVPATQPTVSTPEHSCSSHTRKQSSTPIHTPSIAVLAASPNVHVPDICSISLDRTLDEDCQPSPDSGCYSTDSNASSPLCERTLSPASHDSGEDLVNFPFDWNSDLFETFMSLSHE